MNSKDLMKKKFSNPKEIVKYRLKASVFLFVLSFLVFLLSFYFVGVKFYEDISLMVLPYAYILMLFSVFIYIYYFLKSYIVGKVYGIVYVIYWLIILPLIVVLSSPVLFSNGIADMQKIAQDLLSKIL